MGLVLHEPDELFIFAVEAEDIPSALIHAPLLVRYLLERRTTNKEDLTDGLALSVVDNLRAAPEQFRQHFLAPERASSKRKEDVFIRTPLLQEGDEKEILEDAADRLLDGEPEPAAGSTPPTPDGSEPAALDLIPSLREVVQFANLDPEKLTVAFETDGQRHIRLVDKHSVVVSDGQKATSWKVPSLRELFRGNRLPPPDMDHYPEQYAPHFFFIEAQILTLCEAMGDRTDQEMEEVYSALRRRPDGRSLSVVHDLVWQVAALLLGIHPLSEAEFEALIGALVGSTRKWALRPISRNYVTYLRKTFGEAHSSSILPR